MRYSPAAVLAQFLVDQGAGQYPPAAGFIVLTAFLSDEVGNDSAVCVKGTGSDLQGREFRGGAYFEFPTVQILVRAVDDVTAEAKGYEVQDLLRRLGVRPENDGLGWQPVSIGDPDPAVTVQLRAAHLTTALAFLRQEELNRRRIYVLNAKLDIKEL